MRRALSTFIALGITAACAQEAVPVAAPERTPLVTTTTEAAATTTAAPPTTVPPTTTTAPPADLFALVPPVAARGPKGLAAQIAGAERALRDPSTPEPDVALASLSQQVAYRRLGAHPELDDRVLAALPEDLRRAATLQVAARREFRSMHSKLSSTLPAWRIVRPVAADELLAAYQGAETEFGIPWRYLAAINLVETGLGRIRGTSIAGAQGPMQFMPATWDAYGGGGDINDTHDAIRGAARYLAASNGARDIAGALYHYNHSNKYVRGVQLYADLLDEHPRAFLAFYYWGIWYLTDRGEVYLPVGYEQAAPIPVGDYLG